MPHIPVAERRRQLAQAALRVLVRDGVAAASTRRIAEEAGMAQGAFHYCFRSKQELLHEVIQDINREEVNAVAAALEEGGLRGVARAEGPGGLPGRTSDGASGQEGDGPGGRPPDDGAPDDRATRSDMPGGPTRADLSDEAYLEVTEAIRMALQAYWRLVEADPDKHLLTYELTQYALREPGGADLARTQYAAYQEGASQCLRAVADAAGVRWTLPLPVLARMLVTVVDGLTLSWLVDRDDAQVASAFEAFAEQLAGYAGPLAPGQE